MPGKQYLKMIANETPESRRLRLDIMKLRAAKRLENETPEQRNQRLEKSKQYRESFTGKAREDRLRIANEKAKQKRASETPEQREHRLKKNDECRSKRISRESPQEKEARLCAKREENASKKKVLSDEEIANKKEISLKAKRIQQRNWMRKKRASETEEEKQARLKKRREHRRRLTAMNRKEKSYPTEAELAERKKLSQERRNRKQAERRRKERIAEIARKIAAGIPLKKPSTKRSREEANAVARKRKKERLKTDPQFRMAMNLRNRIYCAVRRQGTKKKAKLVDLCGCNQEFLSFYLGCFFEKGMSWNNYGHSTWHIDHVIPCSAFDLSDIEEQKRCFHFTNLKPAWAKDNLKKSNIIDGKRISYRSIDIQQRGTSKEWKDYQTEMMARQQTLQQ